MSKVILFGILGAVGSGLMIGLQATISSRTGFAIGPVRVGLVMNILGGTLAVIFVLLGLGGKGFTWEVVRPSFGLLLFAGFLGIVIVTGISFALPRIGVMAGLGTVIFGQMFVSIIADNRGWGGGEPIPLSWPRIAGLLIMAFAIFLMLPRGK